MSLATPLLSANLVLLIVIGAISALVLTNEVVLFLRKRKGSTSSRTSAKAKRSKRDKPAKKAKKAKAASAKKSAAPDFGDYGPATGYESVESFEPSYLDYDEEDQEADRLSGKIKFVSEVESMRVSPITAESVRNGRAVSDAWTPRAPMDDYVAGDISGYHSEAGRKSLASQLREAHDSFEYDEVDDESMRIIGRDSSVRITDTRIASSAFRRSA